MSHVTFSLDDSPFREANSNYDNGFDIGANRVRSREAAHHLGVGALRHFLQVVLGARGDPLEEDLLRDAAAQRHAHAIEQLLLRVQELLLGQVLGVAEALAARDDRHLVRRSKQHQRKSSQYR